jgi:co-chaperonin GroES (HSP10)
VSTEPRRRDDRTRDGEVRGHVRGPPGPPGPPGTSCPSGGPTGPDVVSTSLGGYKLRDFPLAPMNDRIVIELDAAPEKVGHIIIPATAKKKPSLYGTVKATGPGMLMKKGARWPMPVKPGDRVVIASETPIFIHVDGKQHAIVRDDIVLAVDDPKEAAE